MRTTIEKVSEEEVLVADLGKIKLYRIVEHDEESPLESTNNSTR
jgi:hypothetical protein